MSRDTQDFDLADFLPYLLSQAAEASGEDFQTLCKHRYGMQRTEWRVLLYLGIYGRMTARDIGKGAAIHKTKVSRAVQKLADRRFLTRQKAENDRRFEYLELTTAGEVAYRDLHEVACQYDARLTGRFTDQETALLRDMLKRLSGRR